MLIWVFIYDMTFLVLLNLSQLL
ncbi:hypothetical protein LINPERHAP1_LOCUS36737 [Linum perenne]